MSASITQIARGEKRRDSIARYIVRFTKEHGYPPTVRQIGAGVGLSSTSTVALHLQKLIDEGRVTMERDQPRTVRVR